MCCPEGGRVGGGMMLWVCDSSRAVVWAEAEGEREAGREGERDISEVKGRQGGGEGY